MGNDRLESNPGYSIQPTYRGSIHHGNSNMSGHIYIFYSDMDCWNWQNKNW
jgi:hypothetical protein